MTRRLLIVAAEFPPVKGIGRLRPLKFCQHLAQLGWETAVLTPEVGNIEPVDLDTLLEIPRSTRVYRAPIPRPKDRMVRYANRLLGREGELHRLRRNANDASREAIKSSTGGTGREGGSMLGSMLGWADAFARRNLLIPDDIVLWSGPAIRAGVDVVREFKPQIILATAPHFTNLLIGSRLAKATGLPWIADYRDLWTGDVLRAWVPKWRQFLELALERRVLASASAVITVSEPKSDVVRGRLRQDAYCKVITLTNGYDPEEFDPVTPEVGPDDVFRIVYAGRLFKNRRGYEFVEGIGMLLREHPEYRGRLRAEYYGGVTPEIASRMSELIDRYDLGDVVRFFPDVRYERSKALQKGADSLLLIVDSGETTSGVVPGKLFEYIAADRPILCIAAPGATAEIMTKGQLGPVVTPGDVVGIKQALKALIDGGKGSFAPDKTYLSQFERAKIVGQLASLLDHVAEMNRGRYQP